MLQRCAPECEAINDVITLKDRGVQVQMLDRDAFAGAYKALHTSETEAYSGGADVRLRYLVWDMEAVCVETGSSFFKHQLRWSDALMRGQTNAAGS